MHGKLRWFLLAALLGVSSCQHVSAADQPTVAPMTPTMAR